MLTTSKAAWQAEQSQTSEDIAIQLTDVSVRYRLPTERLATLKEQLIWRITRRQVHFAEFCALSHVDLQIRRGETVGFIGRNGAGKSTLLKVIAHVLQPTVGRVWVQGTIAPLIELGAGFHHELTGRENIFLYGAMLGFSQAHMKHLFDEIVDFSELDTFIDSPLRTYSSGMTARLGFSVAAAADPDILIIDEVLAVGDEVFYQKCLARMQEFRDRGITILYVTHALEVLHTFCNRAIWIEEGQVCYAGDTHTAVSLYRNTLDDRQTGSLTRIIR